MSSSRIDNSFSGRFMSARLGFWLLAVALCLLAFPRRSAQTSASSIGSQGVASVAEVPSRRLGNSTAGRVADMSQRISIARLPEADGNPDASLSLASGDLDEDGVPDLIVGYAGPGGFSLGFYRGNPDPLYPYGPQAKQHSSLNKLKDSPTLLPGRSFPLSDAPDFLAVGDFNGDGHLDVTTTARALNALYLLTGDGRGDFSSKQKIELPGRVTALGARETGETGGFAEIAVGIVDNSGPAALLFRSLDDARASRPAIIRLPDEATTVVFTPSGLANSPNLLIAAGRELLVVPFDIEEAEAAKALIYHRTFSSVIRSIVVGSFVGNHSLDVAALTEDGAVGVLSGTELGEIDWGGERVNLASWPGSTQLRRARISGSKTDDLVVIDPAAHRLHLLVEDTERPLAKSRVSVSLDIEGEPFAFIPMRLNEDGLDDLIILSAGQSAPTMVRTQAVAIFTVTNTGDNGGVNPAPLAGTGTLRQAIVDANATPDADTIIFSIPGPPPHTIGLLASLPTITQPVTINGTSQPGFSGTPVIELNGLSAADADGLTINASGSVVRGLVINRFSRNGIVVNASNNIIEGNFIGTNATGTFALANTQDGVFISGGSNNTVGGTTSAARNVISGNRNGIQISGGGTGNLVRGNFIGTNAGGTSGLGNSINGVQINGSSNNAVGAVGSASSNTIAFNGAAGVAVTSGNGNAILSNSIFLNGGLGIDLGTPGVTPNDTGDPDVGANNLQNFPVLTSANNAGTSTTIQGTLNSTANTTFRIEFFSNQVSNPSGFGEGQSFIGAVSVTTDASGNASFNPTFLVTVAPGQIITATATDPTNNTSEFSRGIQMGGLSGGQTADLSVLASIAPNPVETGSQVTKMVVVSNAGPAAATSVTVTDVLSANLSFVSCDSTGGGVCGGSGNTRTITFASLAPGASAVITIDARVNCSVANGTAIGNTATVFSSSTSDSNTANNVATATTIATNPPPRISCPGSVLQVNDPGNCTGTVNFFLPVADNCPVFNVVCSPPSGSSFAIGTTPVTCIATDAGGATATCSFTVTVNDLDRIAVLCPANVSVTASPGQCSPVVNFALPTVIDNCPGASVSCAPPSGSSFPLGVTNVLCTAVDAKGVQATCGFTVNVNGAPQAVVRLEGNGPSLEFGPIAASRKFRKLKKQPVRNFTVENIGCLPLVLTLDSINRVGSDVEQGRISDPDDRKLFNLTLVDAAGNETPLDLLTDVRILTGQKQNFKVRFNPLIPAVANRTRGLSADQALPDLITSVITFTQNGGGPLTINLVGHLDTQLALTNPDNPRILALVVFKRIEDEFIIEFTIFDSNLDVNRAVFQFFDKNERPVERPITVDLAPLIRQSGFVTGQSFTIVQRITGAEGHGEIVGVAVTVSDGESSDTANSTPDAGTASTQAIGKADSIAARVSSTELRMLPAKRRGPSTGSNWPISAALGQ
ncbi:MAG: HYR domain-containing protein [Acidobacteriota bacterium]